MAKQDTQANATDNAVDKSMVPLSNPDTVTQFEPDDLRSIVSFQDAVSLLEAEFGAEAIADAQDEIGDGFTMLDDRAGSKDVLLNVPFIMLQWVFAPGDYGKQYLISRIVTERGDKYVLVDGGTGLCDQVRQYTERTKRTGGLLVKRGLRKSEYVNEYGPGTTYYLNV